MSNKHDKTIEKEGKLRLADGAAGVVPSAPPGLIGNIRRNDEKKTSRGDDGLVPGAFSVGDSAPSRGEETVGDKQNQQTDSSSSNQVASKTTNSTSERTRRSNEKFKNLRSHDRSVPETESSDAVHQDDGGKELETNLVEAEIAKDVDVEALLNARILQMTVGVAEPIEVNREEEEGDEEQEEDNDRPKYRYRNLPLIILVGVVVVVGGAVGGIAFARSSAESTTAPTSKSPTNAPTTRFPTEAPTPAPPSPQPSHPCFQTNLELADAVSRWFDIDAVAVEAQYGPMGDWCFGLRVTSMERLFYDRNNFNEDISGWDVSRITVMNRMFWSASSFNQDLSTWDISSVTDMALMFAGASSFNQDLSTWDVSSVTTMNGMFNFASSFNQNLSTWDVSSVTDISYMLYGAESFNQNLCAWGSRLPPTAATAYAFSYAYSCPTLADPVVLSANPPGPFCHVC